MKLPEYVNMLIQLLHVQLIFFQLLASVDPKALKLTRIDDEIYTHFRKDFPDFQVRKLDEDAMKTAELKAVSVTISACLWLQLKYSRSLASHFYFMVNTRTITVKCF